MKTVQMTLDAELVEAVDAMVTRLGTTRSAFTREALRAALRVHKLRLMEQKHRKGYDAHPVEGDEFSVWEDEQAWGDE